MNIYLLRHGIAADQPPGGYPDDRLRPLDARGQEQMAKVAKAMKRLDLGIDLILFSPLLRAKQTAQAVAERLGLGDRSRPEETLEPGGDFAALLGSVGRLDPQPGTILLVGHEPYLSGMLSFLSSGGPTLRAEMKKGGLARVEVMGPVGPEARATLKWLIPPKLLTMST